MTTAITPEVVGPDNLTQVLETSPITAAEVQSRRRRMVKIKAAQLEKMEKDLFIGQQLLEITRTKEYRGIKEGESGLTFEGWLSLESAEMMPDNKAMIAETARYLRGFYYFRQEVLAPPARAGGTKDLPLPTTAKQVRPLLFLLDHLRREDHGDPRQKSYDERRAAEAKAIEIWKAAVTEAKGGVPTFDQVNRARLADAAAEQHRLRGAQRSEQPARPSGAAPSNDDQPPAFTPPAFTPPASSPTASSNAIPAWEIEDTDDSSLDAGAECKRITHAINDAHKAIGLLRGILYSQINKYGSDYLDFLRQVDAGVYSLHNIDEQVQQMSEDIDFISELLVADVGEGELAQSTIEVNSFPTRQ
jgi:hypothetical protein